MSCPSCNKSNCSCSDNCPNKVSDITTFDCQLNIIEVPCGASLCDVLVLLESYTTNMVNELSNMTSVVLTDSNCLGLAAGTYSIQAVSNAVNTAICNINTEIDNINTEINQIQQDISDLDIKLRRLTYIQPGSFSYSVNPNVYAIEVQLIGAGGGSNMIAGIVYAGGGSGAYISEVFNVTPGQTFNFTVGLAGLGNGGDTIWDSSYIAGGGKAPIRNLDVTPNEIIPGWGGVATISASSNSQIKIDGSMGALILHSSGYDSVGSTPAPIFSSSGNSFFVPRNTENLNILSTGQPVINNKRPGAGGYRPRSEGGSGTIGGTDGMVIITEYYRD